MANIRDVPDLSARHLRAVVALARYGSFVAAASYLGLSQPGLSRIIQQAERLLGAALFVRGTRSVAPTPAGRDFIPAAERLLGELSQQAQKLQESAGQLQEQLIIASLMSISHRVLPAALLAFRRRHPKMHIQIRDGLGDRVLEDVRSGLADFGIGSAEGVPDAVAAESVVEEPCCVVLPRGHALGRREAIGLKELAGLPMIAMPPESGLRRVLDLAADRRDVVLDDSIVTNQYASLFDFVGGGLGCSIVPVSALPPDRRRFLVRPLRPAITRRIGVLHLAERPLSPASTAFLDIFRPMLIAAARGRGGGRP
jgi:LysR family transcriptional regulator, carnitine catabolism transcriptional activator